MGKVNNFDGPQPLKIFGSGTFDKILALIVSIAAIVLYALLIPIFIRTGPEYSYSCSECYSKL